MPTVLNSKLSRQVMKQSSFERQRAEMYESETGDVTADKLLLLCARSTMSVSENAGLEESRHRIANSAHG